MNRTDERDAFGRSSRARANLPPLHDPCWSKIPPLRRDDPAPLVRVPILPQPEDSEEDLSIRQRCLELAFSQSWVPLGMEGTVEIPGGEASWRTVAERAAASWLRQRVVPLLLERAPAEYGGERG